MKLFPSSDLFSPSNRAGLLAVAATLLAMIAITDWVVVPNVALGFLYILPVMLAAGFLRRWQILALAVICSAFREFLGPFHLGLEAVPRTFFVLTAFVGAGLYVNEMARNHRMTAKLLKELQDQMTLRQEAELQLRILVESSPLAILITDSQGTILLTNLAAQHLLGFSDSTLEGKRIDSFLPVLSTLQRQGAGNEYFRTQAEAKGRRQDGEMFLAHIWLSTFEAGSERRLAVIVADASEDLRDREESSLRHLLWHSGLMVGAVSHEIRNLCGAIGIVYTNLERGGRIKESEDFRALGSLLEGLRSVASTELRLLGKGKLTEIQVDPVLDNLRIIVEPTFHEIDAEIVWLIPSSLPPVWADSQGLIQVFLNLCQNSQRALQQVPDKRLTIAAANEADHVIFRFQDSGPGIRQPERLFQAFQEGADITGIGLYVSRAIVRGFGGDLRYVPQDQGACFEVALVRADGKGESLP
jgi:two-component system, LuxR family, sensor kinase FixL